MTPGDYAPRALRNSQCEQALGSKKKAADFLGRACSQILPGLVAMRRAHQAVVVIVEGGHEEIADTGAVPSRSGRFRSDRIRYEPSVRIGNRLRNARGVVAGHDVQHSGHELLVHRVSVITLRRAVRDSNGLLTGVRDAANSDAGHGPTVRMISPEALCSRAANPRLWLRARLCRGRRRGLAAALFCLIAVV